MDKKKAIEVCEMIANDQKNDVEQFEGKPFNGRTVAEYFGSQGAAIAALANIVKQLIENEEFNDMRISKLNNEVGRRINGALL